MLGKTQAAVSRALPPTGVGSLQEAEEEAQRAVYCVEVPPPVLLVGRGLLDSLQLPPPAGRVGPTPQLPGQRSRGGHWWREIRNAWNLLLRIDRGSLLSLHNTSSAAQSEVKGVPPILGFEQL